jgi:CRP-like cAMP-binding protein
MDVGSKEIVKKIKLFESIPEAQLDSILERMEARSYPAGEQVFQQGEIGYEFFVILSGKVSVSMDDENGKAHLLANLGPGESFGEMALIDSQKRSATVRCQEASSLSILTADAFSEIRYDDIEAYSQLVFNLAREFSYRLRSMDMKFVKMLKILF